MTATANYQGHKIEARQGEDKLYRAYLKRVATFDFLPMENIEPAKYGRTVIRRAVKALQDEQRERLRGVLHEIDWSRTVADSPDYYSEEELKAMLKAFDETDGENGEGLIISSTYLPFSRPEIERALIRIENMKGALE